MPKQQQKMAAIYCRLSRDDGSDSESNSITNQREMLRRYCATNYIPVYSEYVDDGVSGLTFERDSFKRMISDIEGGKISTVVCKDLSRLGRNNALVAYYTEIYFVERQIRFIAINDNIDSAVGENEIMGFKSVINEFYARDMSKKIRCAKQLYAQQGKRLGSVAPYGYQIDPEDKHKLIINPDTAPIVKRIFEMSANGMSARKIAKTLIDEDVPTRRESSLGERLGYEWEATHICDILRNQIYLGCMVANRYKKPSFKTKKLITCDSSEWVVVPNKHEPIVSQELFDLVGRRFPLRKRPNSTGVDNIFIGIAKCFDCGSNLTFSRNHTSGIMYLTCRNYRSQSKSKKCTAHLIRLDELTRLVLEGIRENAATVRANEHRLEDFIRESLKQKSSRKSNSNSEALEKLTRRKNELDLIIKRLFEKSVIGGMPHERFEELSAGYEAEAKDVNLRISRITESQDEETDIELRYQAFFATMRNYTEVQTLDTKMLNVLIKRIDVHAPEGRAPHRTQQVDIHYNFVKEGLRCGELCSTAGSLTEVKEGLHPT